MGVTVVDGVRDSDTEVLGLLLIVVVIEELGVLECVLERLELALELVEGLELSEGLWLRVGVALLEIVLEIEGLEVIVGVGLDDGGGPILILILIPVLTIE